MKTFTDKLKTTEFWFSILAILIGALLGAGFIGDGTIYAKIGGWIMEALGVAGYTWARTIAKAADGAGKPGYKTTEFWKVLGVGVLIWLQAHAVPEGSKWAEMIGYALSALGAGSYMLARGNLKSPSPFNTGELMQPAFDVPLDGAGGGDSDEGLIDEDPPQER